MCPNLLSTVGAARSTNSLLPDTLTYSLNEAFANGKFESVVSLVGRYIRGDSYTRPSGILFFVTTKLATPSFNPHHFGFKFGFYF